MAQGRKTSLVVQLSPDEQLQMERWQRSTTIRVGLARRARGILLLAQKNSVSDVSRQVGLTRKYIYRWVDRFLKDRINGLAERPGRGRKAFFPPGGRGTPREDRL